MTIDYSTYKFFKIEIDRDGVATLTMDRPQTLNALTPEGMDELHNRIFQDMQADERVKAVIITGAGRGFCSGADVKGFNKNATEGRARPFPKPNSTGRRLLEAMLDCNKPIIAAVNGAAAGLGATLALFCDIIIAAETARFGDTHISVGVVPGDGGTVIWPLLLGPARAKEYLMTGDLVDGKEAERIGLVNKVVPLEDLMPTAKALAKRLAQGPTLAIAWAKHSVNAKIKQDINMLIDTALISEGLTFGTEDHKEAARAFVEKRKPQFKGR